MNLKKFNNFLTLATSKIIILVFLFNQTAFSKPMPPGSGAGDVKVNILILLDNSLSMNRKTITGDAIGRSGGLVELTASNDIIAAQQNMGLSKINYDTGVRDRSFAENGYFRGKTSDANCGGKDSTIISSWNLGIYNDEVYAINHDNETLVRVNSSGVCQEVIDLGFHPRNVLVVGDHLFVGGVKGGGASLWTKNLATGDDRNCTSYHQIGKSWSTTADASLNYFYFRYNNGGWIGRSALNAVGNNYCPSTSMAAYYKSAKNNNSRHRNATRIAIDPEDDNIIFVTSWKYHSIDRMRISGNGNNALRRQHRKGSKGRILSTASKIKLFRTYGLFVSARNDRVYVSSDKPSVRGFADSNLAWNKEIGGSTQTRMQGAKEAINAVVADTSLTTGANFGFGWWSARNKKAHKGGGNPNYFSSWSGSHPDGQSTICNKGGCIKVGVGPNGADDIPFHVRNLGTIFGTDARAFSELALEYYNKNKSWSPIDPDSDCQQSYVIIVGDGEWNQGNIAVSRINTLRTAHKVKTAVVAYGAGISSNGLSKFADMAVAGSCGAEGDADCWQTIIANDPAALKTQLETIIAQFIAESLSFTAPTITAEIEDTEDDHAIYQAQFYYQQHEEWRGHIIRKSINLEGEVDPDATWDAAEEMPGPNARKIWTALEDVPYEENGWDNFKIANAEEIEYLMNVTGEEIVDYHRETADDTGNTKTMRCFGSGKSGSDDIADDIDDDVKGLINFVRGKDYFDYNGNCNLTERRQYILGDVYHSQIITVGKPRANTEFVGINQEAYFRLQNNYKSHAEAFDFRKSPKTLYAGANDGMLHAFNTETGKEMWAFIPPFIVSQLPTTMNANLNRPGGGGSNAIFGVDGSPVIHDMYFEAPHKSGKRWYTIMMLPYGRGGAGFSVLDITHPNKPHHLYSIFNDQINHRVHFANHEGVTEEFDYHGASYDLSNSQEAQRALENQKDAEDLGTEETDSGVYTCSTSSSFLTNDAINNACYKGTSWTFELPLRADNMTSADSLECYDGDLNSIACSYTVSGSTFKVSFPSTQIYSAATADETGVEDSTWVTIQFKGPIVGVKDEDGDPHPYDYSQLGETWSTPRIFRLPNDGAGDASIMDDIYVAVMGAGKGSSANGSGSAVYVINLEDEGKIVELSSLKTTTETKGRGIIRIEDDPIGNIYNSTPASPVVITPDTTIGIPWSGALVYINDYEGKITKINLTNMETKDMGGKNYNLFHHTTLFKTGSTRANGQYMYFSMDATIGKRSRDAWFFAGTGDFGNITAPGHSNMLLGIKDPDYPMYFELPAPGRPGINLADCEDTTDNDGTQACCADLRDCRGWYMNLGESAKVTGEPTVYTGNVYFPVYKPDFTGGSCDLGDAFIWTVDDECGYNKCESLQSVNKKTLTDNPDTGCKDVGGFYVGKGILSGFAAFAGKLFGSKAGTEDQEDTLVILKAAPGEVTTYRSSWRENY